MKLAGIAGLCLLLTAAEEPPMHGRIALSDSPFCDFFVIAAEPGFALLQWKGGRAVYAEGDTVTGALRSPGVYRIHLDEWRDDMEVEIEEVGVDLRLAQSRFFSRCGADGRQVAAR